MQLTRNDVFAQMEDEYDLEVEIERQLALEEEEITELQETLANHKLTGNTTAKVRLRIDRIYPRKGPRGVHFPLYMESY